MRGLGSRISPSLVISVIALFVALGGASYAVVSVPKNSVGTKQLKKRAVGTKQLKGLSVTGAKLGNDAVDSAKVRNRSLLLEDFGAGQLKPNAYVGVKATSPLVPIGTSSAPVVATDTGLPAGNYLIFARLNVVGGSSGASSVTCVFPGDTAQAVTIDNNTNVALSLSGSALWVTGGAATLFCSKSGAGSPSVAQANISALPIDEFIGTPGYE
ncbi:MAG: hypothetical protein ACO3CR_06880 [Solirubrobacterales bacterium]